MGLALISVKVLIFFAWGVSILYVYFGVRKILTGSFLFDHLAVWGSGNLI